MNIKEGFVSWDEQRRQLIAADANAKALAFQIDGHEKRTTITARNIRASKNFMKALAAPKMKEVVHFRAYKGGSGTGNTYLLLAGALYPEGYEVALDATFEALRGLRWAPSVHFPMFRGYKSTAPQGTFAEDMLRRLTPAAHDALVSLLPQEEQVTIRPAARPEFGFDANPDDVFAAATAERPQPSTELGSLLRRSRSKVTVKPASAEAELTLDLGEGEAELTLDLGEGEAELSLDLGEGEEEISLDAPTAPAAPAAAKPAKATKAAAKPATAAKAATPAASNIQEVLGLLKAGKLSAVQAQEFLVALDKK